MLEIAKDVMAVAYFEGCNDQECGTYAAYKSLDLLGVK